MNTDLEIRAEKTIDRLGWFQTSRRDTSEEVELDRQRRAALVRFLVAYGPHLKPTTGLVYVDRLFGVRKWFESGYDEGFPGADHCGLWMDGIHPRVFVSQPYFPPTAEQLQAFQAKYPEAEVEIRPKSESWHYPGECWLVVVTRRKQS